MDAVAVWNMDPVMWMLKKDDKIDKDVDSVVDMYGKLTYFGSFARRLTALIRSCKMVNGEDGIFQHLQSAKKSAEAKSGVPSHCSQPNNFLTSVTFGLVCV